MTNGKKTNKISGNIIWLMWQRGTEVQKSLIYQTSWIERSLAGSASWSPEKLLHSLKVLRATTKVKAQAKRRFLQTGVVSLRRRHVQLVLCDFALQTVRAGSVFTNMLAFGRILWANQVWKKCFAISLKKSHKKLGTANLKVSRNWIWQWKLNMLLIKLSHVLWSRSQFGSVVLVARVAERTSVMIVFTSKKTSSTTNRSLKAKPRHISACYVAIHCSLCGNVLSVKCWNVYLIYLELLPFAIPCDTNISLYLQHQCWKAFGLETNHALVSLV